MKVCREECRTTKKCARRSRKALRAAYIEGAAAQAYLIERQAEEIADNEAFVSILQKTVQRLTAERAELIEALRPFSEWSLELKGMDDDNLLLATYDKEREGNRFGTVGDCRRARALLERLGAVIRD